MLSATVSATAADIVAAAFTDVVAILVLVLVVVVAVVGDGSGRSGAVTVVFRRIMISS